LNYNVVCNYRAKIDIHLVNVQIDCLYLT
jgi:hypothetical protein